MYTQRYTDVMCILRIGTLLAQFFPLLCLDCCRGMVGHLALAN